MPAGSSKNESSRVERRLPAVSVDGHGQESGAMLHLFVKISANGTEDLPVGRSPGAETGENRAGGSTNPKATGKPRRLTRVLGPEHGPTEIRSAIHGMRRGTCFFTATTTSEPTTKIIFF